MKHAFLTLLAVVWLAFFAQSAVAKIKYEEAEEAFSRGAYTESISRLNEVENILGATNPRVLYLRIMASHKLMQADPYASCALLQRLRQHTANLPGQVRRVARQREQIPRRVQNRRGAQITSNEA